MLKLRICVVVVCLLSAVSCRRVLVSRPVPAKEDSVVDTRLIGAWRLVKEENALLIELPSIIVVGRSEKSKTTMEALMLEIPQISEKKKQPDHDEKLQEELHFLNGTLFLHHGKFDIVSTNLLKDVFKDDVIKQPHSMFRYEFQDSNTVLLYKLDIDVIYKAIESKKLGGKFERGTQLREYVPPNSKRKITDIKTKSKIIEIPRTVLLDDDPTKILRYLDKNPDVFEKKPFARLKRMTDSFIKELKPK